MSAQYTRMRMKMLNKQSEPAVSKISDTKAPTQLGCSGSKAMKAMGVYEGWNTELGIRNQIARRTDVIRIRL